jgi:hypothetical protein
VLGNPNSSWGALRIGGGEAEKEDRVVPRIAEHQRVRRDPFEGRIEALNDEVGSRDSPSVVDTR